MRGVRIHSADRILDTSRHTIKHFYVHFTLKSPLSGAKAGGFSVLKSAELSPTIESLLHDLTTLVYDLDTKAPAGEFTEKVNLSETTGLV